VYTVTDTGAPENVDYSELAALTRNFLHDTLNGYFASINDVQYLGTELEFYFIRGVHVMEYQFKTKWGEGDNQVPSIPELNIVVKSVFDSNQQSYMDGMQTALRAENAFSTTTGITLGSQGSNVVVDDEDNDNNNNNVPGLEDDEEVEGSSSNISKKIIIPVSVVAGAAAILIVFVYFRRRKVSPTGMSVQSEEEEHSLKPDEDITLDTAPMASIQTSVQMMSSSQRRPSEMMRQHSKYMESAMDEGLINQREEEFDEVSIDYLAEV
jgi:flagellar basal body-associated protein FliL